MNDDVESLERATLAAVPPSELREFPGWLIGLDTGTVGRSHSAAPLAHEGIDTAMLPAVIDCYLKAKLTPILRLPVKDSFSHVHAALSADGFAPSKRTLVMTGTVEGLAVLAKAEGVRIDTSPTERWGAVFLGEGFDPVDGASRLAILARSDSSVFASVEDEGGRVAAVGSACFSHGWCGVHGMRTSPSHRGRGMASRILATLAREATQRGIARAYLQVEAGNVKAQALYRRAGFALAWAYEYWRRGT